jgi:aspartokinase
LTSADQIRHTVGIIANTVAAACEKKKKKKKQPLVVVLSAIGHTTNALEAVVRAFFAIDPPSPLLPEARKLDERNGGHGRDKALVRN